MSTTRLALEQLLSEALGDYLSFSTTTNIAANTTIVSTALTSYDGGNDDYFIDWWVSFQEGNNAAVAPRQVSDYATATGTLTIRGANLAAEAGAVTLRLHRYNPTNKWNAMRRAIEQLYPTLYKPVDNQDLVAGNMLPNSHFTDWASSSVPDFWSVTNATAAATTTAALYRGFNGKSAKVTASAANGYLGISSQAFPRLLDFMGKSVTFKAWAYPEVADDAALVIYTLKADGTTSQTLTSSTTCPAGQWTLLELENQAINDDIVRIDFRFKVITNVKYAYFDDAFAIADHLYDYVLPSDFQTGHLKQVRVQYGGYSDDPCYDISPVYWGAKEEFEVFPFGDYSSSASPPVFNMVRFKNLPNNFYRIRLIGMTPLESLTADTSTIYLDGEKLNLIVAKSAALLYRLEQGPVSSEDKGLYAAEVAWWNAEANKLKGTHGMIQPSGTIWTGA